MDCLDIDGDFGPKTQEGSNQFNREAILQLTGSLDL